MKKVLKYIFITIIIAFISWILFGIVMTFGHKSMPEVEVPKELKELEKILTKETNGGDSHFNTIPQHKIDECHFEIELTVYMNDDSISKTKESIYNYINSVSKRINERIKNKECMDSLIILVSAPKATFSKSSHFRYSFPMQ